MSSPSSSSEVRTVLQMFQDGYTKREIKDLDEFMELFVQNDQLEIVGTSAIAPSNEEWCKGVSATRSLIAADWESWGDLALDVAAARIQVNGEVAYLATSGTVAQKIPLEHSYVGMRMFLQNFIERSKDTDIDVEGELLTVILGAASALSERRQGEDHVWPIRFTATLIRQQEHWKFHQLHFSYPTIHLPQVRFR